MKPLSELNNYRDRFLETQASLTEIDQHDDHLGMFRIKTKSNPKPLLVVASRYQHDQPDTQKNPPWNHIAVSLTNRTPYWNEMDFVKNLFFESHEIVMQFHLPKIYVEERHKFCLHLWQPVHEAVPLPPLTMLGLIPSLM